jgi:chitinase
VLSVGGGGKGSDNFAAVAANHTSRERFALTAREIVNEYGLDGIDSMFRVPLYTVYFYAAC